MRKVMEVACNGKRYRVLMKEGDINPFWLYEIHMGPGRYGYTTEHRVRIAKYANLTSCLFRLTEDEAFR